MQSMPRLSQQPEPTHGVARLQTSISDSRHACRSYALSLDLGTGMTKTA